MRVSEASAHWGRGWCLPGNQGKERGAGAAALELWECSRKAPWRDIQNPGWSRELGWSSWGCASPARARAQSIPSACPRCQHRPCSTRSSGGHIPWHRDPSHLRNAGHGAPAGPAESPGVGQGQTLPFPPTAPAQTGMCPTAQTSSRDHPSRGGAGWTSPGLTDPLAPSELLVSFRTLRVFCLAW